MAESILTDIHWAIIFGGIIVAGTIWYLKVVLPKKKEMWKKNDDQ